MSAMKAAALTYRNTLPKLTHQQEVTRLYRHALKSIQNWTQRDTFYWKAAEVRARFDAMKHESPMGGKAKLALKEGQKELFEWQHPDPYVLCWMPGGSKFMRNPSPINEVVWPRVPKDQLPSEATAPAADAHVA